MYRDLRSRQNARGQTGSNSRASGYRRRPLSTPRRAKGMAVIWIGLIGLVLLMFVGLACDMAYRYLAERQLQAAADAGALGGANRLHFDTIADARNAAWDAMYANYAGTYRVTMSRNDGNAAGGDIVIGRYYRRDGHFEPTYESADAVQTVTRRPDAAGAQASLVFGKILGQDAFSLRKSAIAIRTAAGLGAGILVLDPHDPSVLIANGTPSIEVRNGVIQVNSDSDSAVRFVGNSDIHTSDLYVVGGASGTSAVDGNVWTKNDGVPVMPDPFGGLAKPTAAAPVPTGKPNVINPGYYSSGITQHNGSLTLNPGIYVLGGSGLNITGGDFYAPNVLIFITGPNASVNLTGNGHVVIGPMSASQLPAGAPAAYSHVSIFQDPAYSNKKNNAKIVGTEDMHIQGTLYFPSVMTDIGGTGDVLGNQLIAYKVQVSGNGTLTINYEGADTSAGRVFLVR